MEFGSEGEVGIIVGGATLACILIAAQVRSQQTISFLRKVAQVLHDEIGAKNIHLPLIVVGILCSLFPYVALKRLKAMLYRMGGIAIGKRTLIYGRIFLTGDRNLRQNLRIGSYCRINTPCRIGLTASVTIGDYVVLGHDVILITEEHDTTSPDCRAGKLIGLPIVIGDGVWIGANSMILPGVTIGDGAVVGAGSVVRRDVPPHTMVLGNPARTARDLSKEAP